jgi:GT2 family glycosyltransferase
MVVPTLGRRIGYLHLALESIRNQDGDLDVDLVIVAPPEPVLADVATRYGARLVPDTGRGGLSGALNAGLAAAADDTDYFGWLGDDDVLHPGSLRATVTALEERPDASMVYGWCDYIDEHGAAVFASRAGRLAARILPWGPNLVPQPGSLMRYAHVRQVGGLDEGIGLAMDLDLFLRLRRVGPLVCLPQTLASFRWHPDSATVRSEVGSAEESDRIRMSYMPAGAAYLYRYLRWPGRWALRVAKRRVDHNVRRQARLST